LSEKEICQEVVQHLNVVQGYDHIAIFLKEKDSDNRILCAYIGDFDFQGSVSIPLNMGLSGKPIITGKLKYTPDVGCNPNYIPGLGQGSEVDIPIIFDEEIFGVIVVENYHVDAFSVNDFTMLSTASDQTALAINNTRLLETEKKRRREAEIFHNATNAVNSDLELNVILDRILNQLSEVVPYDSASIFLLEEENLNAKAVRGLPKPEEVLGKQFPAADPLFQMVLESKEPIIIGNIHENEIFQGWGGTEEISSWMGIPLKVGKVILGILTIDHKENNSYNQEKMEFARIFANQSAVVLKNAQFYQDAKNSAELLLILHQASQKITGASFDPERTYSTIHEAACQLMPCEAFSISILYEPKNEIEAVYLYDREGRAPSVRIPANQGLSGYIISTGKHLLIHDFLDSENMHDIQVVHFGHPDHIRAFIAVPMILGNKVVGMLSSQSYLPL
jgi:GAF domain-containing protein